MLSSRLAAPLQIEAGTGDGEGDARGERRCFNCEVVDAMGEWKWIGQEERALQAKRQATANTSDPSTIVLLLLTGAACSQQPGEQSKQPVRLFQCLRCLRRIGFGYTNKLGSAEAVVVAFVVLVVVGRVR
ncbi:hypothetical protein NA56DRAFT_703117 [Hyaloscypha hepaticicola]|uniref:Uncharacterized protein n=1 Tax=Hyaloscypha hepaticicola TaxID=2082293 RepID=A0A2J6Q786_9HELO|nr:hypothetical protein NA56DRAFT_703117 [Hyaloscypha hepaticicola]